ncbi:MAG TPA: hypothetical protein VGO00_15580 [Kofleriaceae bacterium]|jgi:hypothetical protein|nr:hypothetical protein [Kofleriaceae bacterium]
MAFDPARTFWIANDWYWRIAENAATLTAETAACDFARPLLRLLDRGFELTVEDPGLVVTVADRRTPIALASNVSDRVALDHLFSDLNRVLASADLRLACAIVVPRRYELCGTLLDLAELDRMFGDPGLLVPMTRIRPALHAAATA